MGVDVSSGEDVREEGGYLQAFCDSWMEGSRDEVPATGEARLAVAFKHLLEVQDVMTREIGRLG